MKAANNLSNNNLTIGQTLVIPDTALEEVPGESVYIVKSGDTLYKIAGLYGMTVNELKALNNLTSNNLSVGQRLRVVAGEDTSANTYVVKSGDSLYSIAKKFNITVDALKNANNKTSNLLNIGEVLVIPTNNATTNRIHIVRAGDSLYSIARLYNTTVDEIKRLNNLTSNLLSIGMSLYV